MVGHKTGGLFRLAVKMMQECSERDSDFSGLVNKIGAFFQIRDDYINLQSSEYENNKGYCEDLTEGKFSFVIVHAIRRGGEEGAQLMNILRQRTVDGNVKKYAVGLMDRAGSFDYTRKYLEALEKDILDEINVHGGNTVLEQLVERLSVRNI
ncbi:hypothetical protein GGI07_000223 [Coemansia sp. Benny D115]|nr:hypothetical protein GGI07_000223 [Coemansia sp. Benny D115]